MSVASLLILCSSFLVLASAVAIIHHRDLPESHMNVVSVGTICLYCPLVISIVILSDSLN